MFVFKFKKIQEVDFLSTLSRILKPEDFYIWPRERTVRTVVEPKALAKAANELSDLRRLKVGLSAVP
jgi:hypothetical protein